MDKQLKKDLDAAVQARDAAEEGRWRAERARDDAELARNDARELYEKSREEMKASQSRAENAEIKVDKTITSYSSRFRAMEKTMTEWYLKLADSSLDQTYRQHLSENHRIFNEVNSEQNYDQADDDIHGILREEDYIEIMCSLGYPDFDENITREHVMIKDFQIDDQERQIKILRRENRRLRLQLDHAHSINVAANPEGQASTLLECNVCMEKFDINGEVGFRIGYGSTSERLECGHILCEICASKMTVGDKSHDCRCHVCQARICGYRKIYF